jgi:hypothetical protein
MTPKRKLQKTSAHRALSSLIEPRRGRNGAKALVLTHDDRRVLAELSDDERAMVEQVLRNHPGLTAAEALEALRQAGV